MKHANLVLGLVAGVSLIVVGVASYLLLTTSGTVPNASVNVQNISAAGVSAAPSISTKSDLNKTSNYLNSLNIDSAYSNDTTELNTQSTGI